MKPIYVTQPNLPEFDEFMKLTKTIWDSKILTNNGTMHQQLEKQLCEYLGVPYISIFNNGTIALIVALQALGLKKGEVITTPYTFVATAHSIIWNHLTPIFVDISTDSPNISVEEIEKNITKDTVAILAVHCYGIPCQVEKLQEISNRYKLALIYDAAHAFGVKYNQQSILNYGDLSIVSFHATKVFNTFEGGAIIAHTLEMKTKIDSLKNFGLNDSLDVTDFGLNGKMNEIQAAMGLLQLKHIDEQLVLRKILDEKYRIALKDITGLTCLDRPEITQDNFSYFPVIIEEGFSLNRNEFYQKLFNANIITRKYFHPLITEMNAYQKYYVNTPNAKKLSDNVLCLPMYPTLSEHEFEYIIKVIKDCI